MTGEKNIKEAVKDALAESPDINDIKTKLSQNIIANKILSYDNSAGTSTVDYTVFDTPLAIDFNGKITIQILMNQSTTVQVDLNGNKGYLNAGDALNSNSWYEFDLEVANGDSLNVIIQVPAGANLSGILRIFKRER